MYRSSLLRLVLAMSFAATATMLHATNYYLTLTGAGSQNGSSFANAFSYTNRDAILNTTMLAGDTLYVEGNYYGSGSGLNITSSGTSTAPKSIVGVDTGISGYPHPVFEGTSVTEHQLGCIQLQSGVSYWTLTNLEGRRSGWALHTFGANAGLIINNVGSYNTVHGLGFNDADNLLIENCYVNRYTHYGIHLIQGCDNALIINCHADGTGTGDTPDTFSSLAGFMLHTDTSTDPQNTNVSYEDCSSRNHKDSVQGDGFLVEYNNTGVSFFRCISFDNNQGGFDAKGLNQTFTDCVSVRVGNGYKIWKNGTMHNCIAAETTGNVLFLPQIYSGSEHILDAYDCTFQVSNTNTTGGACVYIENGPSGYIRATLYNCLLTRVNASSTYSKNIIAGGYSPLSGSVDLRTGTSDETKQYNSVSNLANAPKYTAMTQPWKPWDTNLHLTADTAYDSITFGATKGYNSTLQSSTVVDISPSADAYVYNSNPNSNYGTSTDLYVKDAPNGDLQDRITYIKFPVTGLGVVKTATLTVTCTSVDTGTPTPTVELRQVTNDTWTETGVTYNNRPSEAGTLIQSVTAAVGTISFNVTSFVSSEASGDGTVTFALVQPASLKRGVHFASRENATTTSRPVLEVQ